MGIKSKTHNKTIEIIENKERRYTIDYINFTIKTEITGDHHSDPVIKDYLKSWLNHTVSESKAKARFEGQIKKIRRKCI